MRPNKKLKNSCSRSAGDKKNLHPSDRKSIFFLINFPEKLSFVLWFLLLFLYSCLFFEIKNIYSDTHSVMKTGEG